MPVTVRGGIALRKALRNYAPDLAKQLPKEMAAFLKPVVKTARGYMPEPNREGFRSLARIMNKSAAGSIYETAGRKTPDSNFVRNLNGKVSGVIKGKDKMAGRAMFRAFEEDHGKATDGVRKAIEKTNADFKKATTI